MSKNSHTVLHTHQTLSPTGGPLPSPRPSYLLYHCMVFYLK